MPGSLSHLTRRFFDVLTSKPLTGDEIDAVRDWLNPAQAGMFFSQAVPDQRHGYHAASVVVGSGEEHLIVVRAALLHDVGKRHAGLGLIGRSFASVLIRLRLPLTRRARLYRDHGELGADDLSRLGCEPMIVDFARAHHGERPVSISRAYWELLQSADQPPKTETKLGA